MKTDHEIEQALKGLRWEVPPEVDRQILDDAMKARDQTSRRRIVVLTGVWAAAAALILAAVGTIFLAGFAPPRISPRVPPSPAQRVALDKDSPRALSLARLTRLTRDPQQLLDYLDSCRRPLRSSEKNVTAFAQLNDI